MENNKYPYRSLARLIIETVTPLAVSSGEKGLYTDSLVARDVNDLPYIPGTAVAGAGSAGDRRGGEAGSAR